MYYPSSENKGADQLRGYREADLRLCFRICRLLVFSRGGSYIYMAIQTLKCLILFRTDTPFEYYYERVLQLCNIFCHAIVRFIMLRNKTIVACQNQEHVMR